MRTLWAALLVAGMAGLGARAETSQQRGKRVVDEALAALGGQAFLNMQNRVESGRIYSSYNDKGSGMAAEARYTNYLPRPDRTKPWPPWAAKRSSTCRTAWNPGGSTALITTRCLAWRRTLYTPITCRG